MFAHQVRGDAHQPRPRAVPLGPKPHPGAKRAHERLGGQVVGQIDAEPAAQKVMDRRVVTLVQHHEQLATILRPAQRLGIRE